MADRGTNKAFAAAVAAVEQNPASDDAWDALEGFAETNNAPDEVARAYREALDRGISRDVAPHVADRAVRFFQEWFIDSPEALPNLLGAIVDRYPDLDWAFERLVVLHTASARWDELLSLYDRTLAATRDESKRQRLLDDAARLAKDFAGEPDRAVDYLQQLLALDPSNDKLVVSLERLLERRERWNELLALWRDRIPQLDTEDARATRARIAAISLERLHEPQLALKELRELVEESPGHADACAHLERILALETAPLDARREALSLLRKTYEIVERPTDVVRVLDRALSFVQGDDRRLLERECAARLAILGRDEEAILHYAALLRQVPDDTDARKQLRQLARRANRRDLQVQALIDAAEAAGDEALRVPLWLEAADVSCDALDDPERAMDLYERVLASQEVEHTDALAAGHALNSLLAEAGRDEQRLAVLERLSTLERSPSFRRQIAREAARLADKLGDRERALTSHRHILEGDPGDLEAISAVVALLEQMERWEELCVALAERAAASASPHARRADRVRIADIQSTVLDRPDDAVATWLAIREELGEDSECLAALDRLMTQTERWQELGELLSGAVLRERDVTAGRLVRLADIYRDKLDGPDQALPLYEQALELDPADAGARAGTKALIAVRSSAHRAAEALARAFERTDEWRELLELLDERLSLSQDKEASAELLRKAAVLHDERGEDPPAALFALARALPLAPYRRDLRRELLRLGEVTGRWTDVAEAVAAAAVAIEDDSEAAAELRRLEAKLQEQRLEDWAAAFEALRYASVLVPGDVPTLRGLARAAARAGRWPEAAQASVAAIAAVGRVEPALIEALEEAAARLDVWGDLADSVSKALRDHESELPAPLASELYGKIGDWYLDRCEFPKAAAAAADRALELTPDDPEALKRLVRLQQLKPGPELAFTLMRLDKAADERFLDALRDAAVLALEDDNRERARAVIERLYRKATALWLAGTKASGEVSAEEGASWALEKLVENLLADHKRERAARVLFEGAGLPFGPERTAELSLRSAELWVDLNQHVRATDAFRVALDAKPDDLAVIRRLAELLEREEARTGSVSLRERELALTADRGERLSLRLAGARRAADLEKRSGRIETLLANLADQPGHGASLDQLHTILDERGRHAELCQVLEQQAGVLESGEPENAAALWAKAAVVAEKNLGDPKRAIADHERVVALAQGNESLDALARLHLEAEAPQEAVRWLERRLSSAAPKERVAVLLKLARTYIKANREADAVATLQTAFAEAPQSVEVRQLLIRLLRSRDESGALADVLATAVEHAADEATVLAYAREAADLYHDKLELPERSVSVLRRAVALAPGDKKLRAMLAEGLRARDELDEARAILAQLIDDYGRRGSKERAEAHLLLGRVLHAQGAHDEALAQLDTAAKMDADNLVILRELAEMARDAGQLERAEGALRTLLLTARRLQAAGAAELAVGTGEVLFELSSIAAARGQHEQAEELAESAIESLAENDAHAPRLQAKLRARGDYDLLVRLLDSRLEYTRSPYRRGQILGEKADVIREHLNRPEEAFKVRLEAIDVDPGSPLLHEGTRELAASLNALDQYIAHLESALQHARRGTDAIVRCELLLRLGEIHEIEKNDLDKASELYAQAKETGVREVDVLRAQARIAVAQGDEIEHLRLLEALSDLGEDQSDTRADALYRMAEVQLSSDESLEQGLEMLRKAITEHPRVERAAAILRRAAERHPEHDGLLDVYEQVARDGGDHNVLLHCLELRSARPHATTAQVREAVAKARELGDPERAERLMERGVAIARASTEGIAGATWALLGLAERAKERGDLESAVQWLREASEVADPERIYALAGEVALLASSGSGDPRAAAKLFERLRERDPTARQAWRPLVDIYREIGDIDALERVVRETLDGLQNAEDRNALRIELARALFSANGRTEEALQVLRDALADDPSQVEALGMLGDHLEQTGRTADLIELLREQLVAAKKRGDAVHVSDTARRLGALLEPSEAAEVYRDALAWGDDAELLRTLLALLGPDHDAAERAELGERLLALSDGEEAAALAGDLADLFASLEDDDGQRRTLLSGIERAPGHAALQQRLEQYYRAHDDFLGLASVLRSAADAARDPERRIGLWRESALIYRDHLGDPRTAVALLKQARELAPHDAALCIELATSLAANADHDEALATLEQAAAASGDDADKLLLLRARATMRSASGDARGALADLDAAFAIDPAAVGEELLELLDVERARAAAAGDIDSERLATLRSYDVLVTRGEQDRASKLLRDWTERSPDDVQALLRLRDLDASDENWSGVAEASERLVSLLDEDEQVEAATGLLDACERLGAPERARESLERVWSGRRSDLRVRGLVRRLYELVGAHRELATLLIEEAQELEDVEQKAGYLRWAGEALLSVGDIGRAVEALTQLLEIMPEDAQARCLLADSYTLSGRYDEAHQLLDEAIANTRRTSPDLHLYHHRKAYVAAAQEDTATQLEQLKRAHHSNRKNGRIAAELADLAEALEEWDLAVATLRIIPTIEDDCPITAAQALLRQGRIAYRLGDRKRALLCARRANLADGESDEVKAFLAELGEG